MPPYKNNLNVNFAENSWQIEKDKLVYENVFWKMYKSCRLMPNIKRVSLANLHVRKYSKSSVLIKIEIYALVQSVIKISERL